MAEFGGKAPTGRRIRINGFEIEVSFLSGIATEENPRLLQKLYARDELARLSEIWRQHNIRIAFTTGVYDMIHVGHMRYLQLARGLGDLLVVGLNSDQSVRRIKGPGRPILTEGLRAEALSALQVIDYICIFDEPDGAGLIRAIKPDAYLCVEGSWTGEIETKSEVVAMAEHSGRVFYTPRQHPNLSTTAILDKIAGTAVADFKREMGGPDGQK